MPGAWRAPHVLGEQSCACRCPGEAWSLVPREREQGTLRHGYPKSALSLRNGRAAVGRPDRLPVPLAWTWTSLPSSRSCCPSYGAWDEPLETHSSPAGRVALVPAVTLCWRKRREGDGLWRPEEPSGNLFRSRWVLVQAGRSQWDEAGVPLAQLFLERWDGSLAATGVWAQVAPLYPGVLAGLPDGHIGQWFPAPRRCQ